MCKRNPYDRRRESIPINFEERRKNVWDRRYNGKEPIPFMFIAVVTTLIIIGIVYFLGCSPVLLLY